MISVHRFVPFARVPIYLALGWMALPTLAGCHHGWWSVDLVWLCDCDPVEPCDVE